MMFRRVALPLAFAFACLAIATASAHAGDETPTPVATPTSEVPELAAPTDLRFDGDALVTWTDNAVGEDEYQVVVRLNGRQGNFSLPADSTSIVLPDVARVDCTTPPFQGSLSIDVYATALDLAGDAASLVVAYDCPRAFASPTPPLAIRQTPVIEGLPALPATGTGDSGGRGRTIVLSLLVFALGACVLGLTVARRRA